jgi:drug/metabolite transporter (DMT)-like permease
VATAGAAIALVLRGHALVVQPLPPSAWAALLFLGLLAQGLAFLAWQVGVARLGASRAGLYLYLEPLATTAVAVPLFGEPFGIAAALGGALVLLGVALGEGRRLTAPAS